jgi:hypothetical protein
MPPAKDKAIAPLPTPQREISPLFTLMPILSGYFKRTSGRQPLLLVMTYIATFIAAWTFPRTRSDVKQQESKAMHLHKMQSFLQTPCSPLQQFGYARVRSASLKMYYTNFPFTGRNPP